MSSWDSVNFGNEKRVRIDELIKIVDYRKVTKFRNYRFVGDLQKHATVWLPIYKDGKPVLSQSTNKPVNIPFNITNFDPETETFDKTRECPFVEVAEKIRSHIKDEKQANQFKPQVGYYGQAINRDLQENPDSKGKPTKEERASGFKADVDSAAFTPVECHNINYTVGQGLQVAMETNTVKKNGEKKSYPVAHPKYGCDVLIKYDAAEKGQGKYKVQKGERTPLDAEVGGESKYLLWDIVSAIKKTTIPRKEAKIEAERILSEFMKSVKKKSSDDEDDDIDDMPDDIEEMASPVASKKKKKKIVEDEDDEVISSPVLVKKKKKVVEDEDEDDDTDSESSPVPAKKKKKPVDDESSPVPVKKKKKVVDVDEEDEEVKPAKKKKKPAIEESSPVPVKKKKKAAAVEDDEDEDDSDDEEIEIDLSDIEDDSDE